MQNDYADFYIFFRVLIKMQLPDLFSAAPPHIYSRVDISETPNLTYPVMHMWTAELSFLQAIGVGGGGQHCIRMPLNLLSEV